MDFAARRKEAEKAGLIGGGDYLKLKEGANRLRLLSECLPHASVYNGSRTFKWLCYVIDRVDGKVKLFFMPHKIYKAIEALQFSEDYTFSDVPMPYDLTINAENAGTMQVKYALIPAKKEKPLTSAEVEEFAKVKPLAEIQKALKDKAGKPAQPAEDERDTEFNPADLEDEDVEYSGGGR
jgi:hypothetical protein